MTRWWAVAVAVASLAAGACGTGASSDDASETTAAAADSAVGGSPLAGPRYREITLASGTALRLELASAVASDTSHVEDPVRATLRQPVVVDGQEVLPAGTEVLGVVTGAERSGRVKGRAQVAYRFNSLRLDGERYDISTSPISHMAPATKGEDATKIAVGAGAGAAVGALLGGGDGAAKGAALGGAGGTGVVLATRGKEVRVGPGTDVTARLTAPAVIRVRVG